MEFPSKGGLVGHMTVFPMFRLGIIFLHLNWCQLLGQMLEHHWDNTPRQRYCFRPLGKAVHHFCMNILVWAGKPHLRRGSFSPYFFSQHLNQHRAVISIQYIFVQWICKIELSAILSPTSNPRVSLGVSLLLHQILWIHVNSVAFVPIKFASPVALTLGFEYCPPHYYNSHPPDLLMGI